MKNIKYCVPLSLYISKFLLSLFHDDALLIILYVINIVHK